MRDRDVLQFIAWLGATLVQLVLLGAACVLFTAASVVLPPLRWLYPRLRLVRLRLHRRRFEAGNP